MEEFENTIKKDRREADLLSAVEYINLTFPRWLLLSLRSLGILPWQVAE